jgi:hypothetical protein
MITKELIKAEIDRVQDKYLEVLYKIVEVMVSPIDEVTSPEATTVITKKVKDLEWHNFIEETYGCLAGAPIERGEQGQYEIREAIG